MRPAWPESPEDLMALQEELGSASPPAWAPKGTESVGGCFVCFPRGAWGSGSRGDPAWAGAAALRGRRVLSTAGVIGVGGAPYLPGLLAAREGPVLESAVRALGPVPDVLLVNATGRDHPRGAGLALHLGWVLDLPSVGVTHRPLLAEGDRPPSGGDRSPLILEGVPVGHWVTTRPGARPVAAHAAWRTTPEVAAAVVIASSFGTRTPEPLRQARRLARRLRAERGG